MGFLRFRKNQEQLCDEAQIWPQKLFCELPLACTCAPGLKANWTWCWPAKPVILFRKHGRGEGMGCERSCMLEKFCWVWQSILGATLLEKIFNVLHGSLTILFFWSHGSITILLLWLEGPTFLATFKWIYLSYKKQSVWNSIHLIRQSFSFCKFKITICSSEDGLSPLENTARV